MLQYQMSNTGGQCWCSFEPCPICEIQFQDSVLKFVSDKTSKLKKSHDQWNQSLPKGDNLVLLLYDGNTELYYEIKGNPSIGAFYSLCI